MIAFDPHTGCPIRGGLNFLADASAATEAIRPVSLAARRAPAGVMPCIEALRTVSRRGDARRLVAEIAKACRRPRPAWYREDRPGDVYACTLDTGAVLAWACFAPGEPLELMAWVDGIQGDCVWREDA